MKTKLSLLLLGLVVAGLIPFTENIRAAAPGQGAVAPTQSLPSVWPEPYTVQRNRREGTLALSVPYYTIQYDLHRGGAIAGIRLTHGQAANLLVQPLETRVIDADGRVFSDLADAAPVVFTRQDGLNQLVTVESELKDPQHQPAGVRVKTLYDCRWGYLKIHRELSFSDPKFRAREICPVAAVLAPTLTAFGYRDGLSEQEGAPAFPFGSCHWGRVKLAGEPANAIPSPFVPHYVMLANPGVEGLEWFAADDLAQWESPLSGQRGQGRTLLAASAQPDGIRFAISPYQSETNAAALPARLVFDFYLGLPLLEGHAFQPWLNASFNRNHGDWVSPAQIRQWATNGIQTVHCHNDGDYYGDGLYWRDGSYPPYPDMDKYDAVLNGCHQAGLRTATYFSNKELNPDTPEYQAHSLEWGRMNRTGRLEHNGFNDKSEFGAQMCLHSGWLDFFKHSVDRVLAQNPLDGVYYDWSVALRCSNPRHEGLTTNQPAAGHWDIDELLNLMEWTRHRVGPNGLVIIHNTSTPLFAAENFASHVVAHEWGYPKWTGNGPDLTALPLEWSLVNARPRGVISYNMVGDNASPHLHRLFALQALLSNVSPWPASPEAEALYPVLKPIGDLATCRFADWRNPAVTLTGQRFGSAIFSRPGEAWILLGNLDDTPRQVTCAIQPGKLPYPLTALHAANRLSDPNQPAHPEPLDIGQLTGPGVQLTLPADTAILLHVR